MIETYGGKLQPVTNVSLKRIQKQTTKS